MCDSSSDFSGLETIRDAKMRERVKQARIQAREIITRLEPAHIDHWPGLIFLLEECLADAKRSMKILGIKPGKMRVV